MDHRLAIIVTVAALVIVIVASDILFFRHHLLARLIANIGFVAVFAGFWLRYK